MKKKLSIFIILIGITVALYPLMEQVFAWYWQQKLLSELENQEAIQDLGQLDELLLIEEEEQEEERAPLTPQGEVLGVLIIDSIKVRLPIISGLNETNLKIGISFLEDTTSFGEYGNAVVAGHRGHSHGRLLNRLNEVKINDRIVVSTSKGDYNYTVYNKVIVRPEEIHVLRTDKKEKVLSIVTCEPIRNPTHRLIVQAKQND
ncbi:class D sortase [Desulfitibacter alkalitolerans]|uniref:class D sortase n=1 Tax=Desulfitibacter alkalitolerans TaxID=264641 RepID=UPI0004817E78|nr:class D sortase [Desulfitibacter alkalitolerans]